jgi:hypothetical protein
VGYQTNDDNTKIQAQKGGLASIVSFSQDVLGLIIFGVSISFISRQVEFKIQEEAQTKYCPPARGALFFSKLS